ncbi:hypothetical protein [uncultured Adlercreutzia sp.]|uniref:hypothetical protein n=1 Tax=uncultured Adlercreutzia sp. TaxID=875803 RepID=UPI002676AC65|nr:hypothetical protein [uncultured Adlercreutzia sp.]
MRRILLVLCVAVSLITLAGCSSNHPITKAGEACASCHSDGRAAAEGDAASAALADATETGLTFTVESAADKVYLCAVAVADGGTIVPAQMRTLTADELGSVTVSEPGVYALCTGEISSPSSITLINATESAPADTVVKL